MDGLPVLVGREHERARLRSVIEQAMAGEPSMVLVHGEAGIGKTSLVREAAAVAQAESTHVLLGQCLRFGGDVTSYLPFTQALNHWLHTSSSDARRRLAPDARLEDVVPALSEGSGGLVLLQIGSVLDRLQSDRPTVLVIDDLQWSDPSSLDVMSYLVAGLVDGHRLAILATYRDTDLEEGHRLHGWLADSMRMPRVHGLGLDRMDLWDIEEMVLARAKEVLAAQLAGDVWRRSGGNPYLAHLLIDDASATRGVAGGGRLVDALAASWHRLSAVARRVTQILAVAGAPTALPVLQVMATHQGVTPQECNAAVLEAAAQGVTVTTDSGAIWFRHPLFVETIAGTVHHGDLADLHASLAATWAAATDVDERDRATSLALHHLAAGDVAQGFTWSVRAADEAEAIRSWEEVSSHLSTAVSLLESLPAALAEEVDQAALLQRAAQACWAAGDDRGAVAHHERALARVDRSTAPVVASRILLELHILRDLAGRGSVQLSRVELQEVLDLLSGVPNAPERAQAFALLSLAETFDGRASAGREYAEAAVFVAQASGDDAALVWALGARSQSRWGSEQGITDSEQAFARAREGGDMQLLCRSAILLSNSHASAGRCADAAAVADVAYLALRDAGSFDSAAAVGALWALRSFQLGRWNLVRPRIRELLSIARSDNSAGMTRCAAALMSAHEGNERGAALHLRRAEELLPAGAPIGDPLLDTQIQVAIAVGDPMEALRLVRTHMPQVLQVDPFTADGWLQFASRAAFKLAELPDGDPRRRAALRQLDVIEALRGDEPPRFSPSGPRDHIQPALGALHAAQRAHCLAEDDEAELWEVACAATEVAGMSFEHARALVCLARLLLTRRLDRGRAVAALTAARAIAAELGAVPLVHEVDVLAAQAHLHLTDAVAPQGVRHAPALRAQPPFTRRETEIVEGLLSGETYAQIAGRLVISEKTVSTHVSHILRKTGTNSRIQLAERARTSPVSSAQDD